MAISLIRTAESHTGTTGSVSQASFTFAVGQAGDAPKGILVFVFQGVSNTEAITSVTYGGTTVPPVTGGRAEDTTTEPGACKAFFLGSAVPQGAPSGGIVVTRTNNTTTMYAVAYLLGGSVDTRKFGTPYTLGQNAAMAQQSIVAGATTTQVFAAAYSGGVTVPTGANMTIGTGTYLLYAAYAFFSGYETTPTTGTRTRGLTCATDDLGYVIVTIGEVVGYAATGQADAVSGISGSATVKRAATGIVAAVVTAASATAMAARAASGVAGAVVTGLSGTATVTEGVSVYPATGQVDSSTALSGTALVNRAATGVAGAIVTGASATPIVKRAATGAVDAATALSGAAFRWYAATGSIEAVTGLSATPTTTRIATGSIPVVTGADGSVTALFLATGSIVSVTGISGAVFVRYDVAGTIAIVSGISGAATIFADGYTYSVTGVVAVVSGVNGAASIRASEADATEPSLVYMSKPMGLVFR